MGTPGTTVTYQREHYEAILALFERRSPRVGPLAAMQEAMEAHDEERVRLRLGKPVRRSGEDRAARLRTETRS